MVVEIPIGNELIVPQSDKKIRNAFRKSKPWDVESPNAEIRGFLIF